MSADARFWHGGKPGLRRGDLLLPGNSRRLHEGCTFCEARAAGKSVAGIDPPSAKEAVYITSDKEYARFYASMYGLGDLYVVEPVGEMEPSPEDHFPSWTVGAAKVVSVYQRAILLKWSQRRALWKRWEVADREHESRAAREIGGGNRG